MDDLSFPTAPTTCGFLVALPMTYEAIESALLGGPYADYVGRGALWGSPRDIWLRSFEAVATTARAVTDRVAGTGVNVRTDGTLDDLAALFRSMRVVTVVAHWRGADVSTDDIKSPSADLIAQFAGDGSKCASRLREGFPPTWRADLDRAGTERNRCSRLAELLNARMRKRPPLHEPPAGTEWHMDELTLRHENRDALDGWLKSKLKPGNRLELADGLHAPSALNAVVPSKWRGIADFSNCHSAQLINEIKQGRPDRVVISNELETNPVRRLTLLAIIYDLLARSPANYADVRFTLAKSLIRSSIN